jgi:hypothetical protein
MLQPPRRVLETHDPIWPSARRLEKRRGSHSPHRWQPEPTGKETGIHFQILSYLPFLSSFQGLAFVPE